MMTVMTVTIMTLLLAKSKPVGSTLSLLLCLLKIISAAMATSSTISYCVEDLEHNLHNLKHSLDSEMEQLQLFREQLTSLSTIGANLGSNNGREEEEGSTIKKTYLPLLKRMLDDNKTNNVGDAGIVEEELNNILVITDTVPRMDAVGAASLAWETIDKLAHILQPRMATVDNNMDCTMDNVIDNNNYITKEDLSNLYHNTYQPLFQKQFLDALLLGGEQADGTDDKSSSNNNDSSSNIFFQFVETEVLPDIWKKQQLTMNDNNKCQGFNETTFDRILETAIELSYSPLIAEMPWLYSEQALLHAIITKYQAAEGQVDDDTTTTTTVNLLAPISGYAYIVSDESSNITSTATATTTATPSSTTNLLQILDSPFLYKVLSLIDDLVESISGYHPFVDHCVDAISSFGRDHEGDEGSIKGALIHLFGSLSSSKIVQQKMKLHDTTMFKDIVAATNIQQQFSSYYNWIQSTWAYKTLTAQSRLHFSNRFYYPHSTNNKLVIVGRGSNGIVMPLCWNSVSDDFKLSFRLTQPATLLAVQIVKVVTDESNAAVKYYHAVPKTIHVKAWEDNNNTSEVDVTVNGNDKDTVINLPLLGLSTSANKVTITFTGSTKGDTMTQGNDDVCIGGLVLIGTLL